MALCPGHLALLHAAVRWASVDKVVGASRVLPCEACALLDRAVATCRPYWEQHARTEAAGGAVSLAMEWDHAEPGGRRP